MREAIKGSSEALRRGERSPRAYLMREAIKGSSEALRRGERSPRAYFALIARADEGGNQREAIRAYLARGSARHDRSSTAQGRRACGVVLGMRSARLLVLKHEARLEIGTGELEDLDGRVGGGHRADAHLWGGEWAPW